MGFRQLAVLLGVATLAATISVEGTYAQGRGSGQSQGQRQGQAQQQRRPSDVQQQQVRDRQASAQQQEIRDRLRSRDVYGRELMTAEERRQYRERVNSAASDREWAQVREQNMSEMRARAQAQGQALEPPVYGQHMLTTRERNEYQERIASARSDTERDRIREEHREMIRERARQLGLEIPPFE